MRSVFLDYATVSLQDDLDPAALLRAMPGLELRPHTGQHEVGDVLEAAREHGIAVCNLRDYCTASVVQHVMGTLLLLTHKLREYGALGRGVARAAQAFGMEVLVAHRPGGPPVAGRHHLDDLLPQADGADGWCEQAANRQSPGSSPAPPTAARA